MYRTIFIILYISCHIHYIIYFTLYNVMKPTFSNISPINHNAYSLFMICMYRFINMDVAILLYGRAQFQNLVIAII